MQRFQTVDYGLRCRLRDSLCNVGDDLYFVTDSESPRRRLIAVNLQTPAERREVNRDTDDVLQSASLLGDRWFTDELARCSQCCETAQARWHRDS